MSEISKDTESTGFAAYHAYLEDGQLVMEPYCSCGSPLDENYHCKKCDKHCKCTDVLCEDQATLTLVEKYVRTSPKFRNFSVMLGKTKKSDD